jgi:hypothetical protein
MKIAPFAVGLLMAWPQFAAVQYYVTDRLTTIDTNKWTTSGKLAPGPAGLSAPDPAGGSIISKAPIPDGTSDAEVDLTLSLTASGGVYTAFLEASPDAHTSGTGAGSYLAFEMQNPKFDSSGHCSANFVVLQSAGGVLTALASFQHACRNGMVMRLAAHSGVVLVWADEATPSELFTTLGVGQPGVGLYGTPIGNSISLVELGAIGKTPLPAITSGQITTAAFRNRVGIQWPAVQIAATSSGLGGYWIYRDGDYLGRTTHTSFVDESITPGAKHTYTIYVVDQHFNPSAGTSVTVTVPVATPKNGPTPAPVSPKK